jgi:hypothetical protein
VGLERGLLSLVSTTEELLERKCSNSDLETVNKAIGIHHADHVTPSICKSGGHSVGIVHSQTKATELFINYYY